MITSLKEGEMVIDGMKLAEFLRTINVLIEHVVELDLDMETEVALLDSRDAAVALAEYFEERL